jgi:hypothetical protein
MGIGQGTSNRIYTATSKTHQTIFMEVVGQVNWASHAMGGGASWRTGNQTR